MESALEIMVGTKDDIANPIGEAKCAIEALEAARIDLEKSVAEGRMDLTTYSNACTTLSKAITQLEDRLEKALV